MAWAALTGLQPEGFTYVLYDTGEEELYDLKVDPFQLDNVADDPAYTGQLDHLSTRLAILCQPPPPGWPGLME
jgi:hypothetical protein